MQPGNSQSTVAILFLIHFVEMLRMLGYSVKAVIVQASLAPLRVISHRGPHGRHLLHLLTLLSVEAFARHKLVVVEHGLSLTHRWDMIIVLRLILALRII